MPSSTNERFTEEDNGTNATVCTYDWQLLPCNSDELENTVCQGLFCSDHTTLKAAWLAGADPEQPATLSPLSITVALIQYRLPGITEYWC